MSKCQKIKLIYSCFDFLPNPFISRSTLKTYRYVINASNNSTETYRFSYNIPKRLTWGVFV